MDSYEEYKQMRFDMTKQKKSALEIDDAVKKGHILEFEGPDEPIVLHLYVDMKHFRAHYDYKVYYITYDIAMQMVFDYIYRTKIFQNGIELNMPDR